MTTSPPVPSPLRPLKIAGILTIFAALSLIGTGIASLLQGHGMFSAGVGTMLVIYGLLVAVLGVGALRGIELVSGMLVGAAVLHVFALVEIASHDAGWVWFTLPLFLATVAFGLQARIRSNRQLGASDHR